MSIDATSPSEAIFMFRQARDQLFGVLDDLAQEAKLLGAAAPGQRSKLDSCRDAVRDDQAECGIVGAEGVGKSTLINAILGERSEIVPTEKHRPGTVAPTYIRFGAGEPNYVVSLLDDAGGLKTLKNLRQREFQSYALQRENPNNEKRVQTLEVYLNNPLLEGGLTLVDIPGGEGVSAIVREQTRDFLANREHAVVGVVRERAGYGALKRLLGEDRDLSERIGALIYNTATDTIDASTPADIAEELAAAREGFVESVVGLGDLEVLASLKQKTFVTHLRNLANGHRPLSPVEIALAEQGQLALSQIGKVLQQRSVAAVLTRGVERTLSVLTDFQGAAAKRQRVIEALLAGDSGASEIQATRDTLRLAQHVALEGWDTIEGARASSEALHVQVAQVAAAMSGMKRDLQIKLGRELDAWNDESSRSQADLQELQADVETIFAEQLAGLKRIWIGLLVEVSKERGERRRELYNAVLMKLELFKGTEADDPDTPESTFELSTTLTVDRGDDVRRAYQIAGSLAAMSAPLGAMGGIGVLPAIGSLIVAGYGLVRHLARGGNAGAGRSFLQQSLDSVSAEFGSANDLAEEWLGSARSVISVQRQALVSQIKELENLLEQPKSHEAELIELHEDISAAVRRIAHSKNSISSIALA